MSNNPILSPILSPLDAANLQTLGLLGPGTTPSSHRIHKRRVNGFSNEEYPWVNWPSTSRRREIDPHDGNDGSRLPTTFLAFILECTVNNTPGALTEEDDDWRRCLDKCGINKTTQDAIMDPDPELTYIRLSDSCLHWIRD
ncbi:hypothetical protein VE03_07319 [Pseudogymnoascus sp. 23342-1-I1]|nr:hypothetical protein VE03_07319 [Pseudogymnoascus sp. 23342-1-I1]